MRRLLLLVLTTLMVVAGWAQQAAQVRLPSGGEFETWSGSRTPSDARPDTTAATSNVLRIEAPENSSSQWFFVHNVKTGRVAAKAWPELIENSPWTPAENEFRGVFETVLNIRRDGQAVTEGSLIGESGATEFRLQISNTDGGQLTVYNLPVDQLRASLEYKADGETRRSEARVYDIAVERDKTPTVTIDAPSDATVAPTQPSPSGSVDENATSTRPTSEPAPPVARRGAFQSFVGMLLGLALIGGMAYAGYWYYKNNQTKVDTMLKQAGIDPKTDTPVDSSAPVPVPDQDKPLQQIVLAGGDPTTRTPAPVAPSTPSPQLTGSFGSFEIQEGEWTVGRENADLTLTEDTSISRNHAKVSRQGSVVTLTDLGSTNGTYVNGHRIDQTVTLAPGDIVQFGAVQLSYSE